MDSLDLFKLVCNEPSIADVPKILSFVFGVSISISDLNRFLNGLFFIAVLNKLDAFEIHFNKEVAKFRGVFPDYTGTVLS
jgi:hypothetical protein